MKRKATAGSAWQRGRLCSDGACVEVAATAEHVFVRDGKSPDDAVLCFTRTEWEAFLGSAKLGDFDNL